MKFAAWISHGMSREHMLSSMPHAHFPDKEGKHRYDFGSKQEKGSCTGQQRLVSCLGLLEGGLCSSYADQDEGLSVGRLCLFPLPPPLMLQASSHTAERGRICSRLLGVCVVVVVGENPDCLPCSGSYDLRLQLPKVLPWRRIFCHK